MFKLLMTILFLSISTLAFGASESEVSMPLPKTSSHSHLANINQGNFEVGGSLNFGYDPNGRGLASDLNPQFRYFFANHFSFGVATEISFSKNYSNLGIGPSLAFYFFNTEKWAFFIGEDFLLKHSSNTYFDSVGGYTYTSNQTYGKSNTKLGANYFITREVAVGPSVAYNFEVGDFQPSDTSYFNLMGQFSIYF